MSVFGSVYELKSCADPKTESHYQSDIQNTYFMQSLLSITSFSLIVCIAFTPFSTALAESSDDTSVSPEEQTDVPALQNEEQIVDENINSETEQDDVVGADQEEILMRKNQILIPTQSLICKQPRPNLKSLWMNQILMY